jgi:hypothetical protein
MSVLGGGFGLHAAAGQEGGDAQNQQKTPNAHKFSPLTI